MSLLTRRSGWWCCVLLLTLPVQSLVPIAAERARAYRRMSLVASSPAEDTLFPTSIYIHIPFCRQRCRYCDFAIVPVGSTFQQTTTTTTTPNLEATYLRAVLHELDRTLADLPPHPLHTIYFGGGTPSLAQASTMVAILNRIRRYCTIADDAEITVEMDPGTFDASYVRTLVAAVGEGRGRLRVSLGVQAADDAVLASLGRTHRRVDIDAAIRVLRQEESSSSKGGGVDSISMDLITGVPGVSLAAWMDCLATAVHTWQPHHLSVYDLQVEPGTVFGRWYDETTGQNNPPTSTILRPPLPTPQQAAAAYQYTSAYLHHHGWEHYEVSSYARNPPSRSRHNQAYWKQDRAVWYAVGLGATSCVPQQMGILQRHRRPRAMADYIAWVHRDRCDMSLLEVDDEDGDDYWTDIVLRRLRTSDGLDLSTIEDAAVVVAIERGAELALELGLAYYTNNGDDQHKILRLSDPQGFLFSNTIISSILVELERRHT